MDWPTLTLIAIAAVFAASVIVLALQVERGRRRADTALSELGQTTAQLITAQAELAGRVGQISQQSAADRVELTRTLQERLDGVSRRMGESLEQSATKTATTLGELSKHLSVIDRAQQNISELAGQVVSLQDILSNKQSRGAFGEIQLIDLVKGVLPPSAYGFQVNLGNNKRVDCLIRLPQPPGPICIDSKFPLESYHALRQAGDDGALKQAQRDFRAAFAKHIADIRERYIVPGETADSALMFLPSEAVYAELHANFPEVVEQSYRARVWIVSPTTLMATLNTVRAVLKDARMREQAGVIQVEVGKLIDDVKRLDRRVDNLRKHFSQAEGDLKEIGISTTKIVRRADAIEDIPLDEDEAQAAPEPEASVVTAFPAQTTATKPET